MYLFIYLFIYFYQGHVIFCRFFNGASSRFSTLLQRPQIFFLSFDPSFFSPCNESNISLTLSKASPLPRFAAQLAAAESFCVSCKLSQGWTKADSEDRQSVALLASLLGNGKATLLYSSINSLLLTLRWLLKSMQRLSKISFRRVSLRISGCVNS